MKTCALVCGASFARADFCERHERGEFDFVVAVDSGYTHLQAACVRPDVCLGDFDSLGFVPEGSQVHPAIKDKSDLELALCYALEQGFSDVVVYGCLGERIDHTISALQLLASAAEGKLAGGPTGEIAGSAGGSRAHGTSEDGGNRVRIRAIGGCVGAKNHANARAVNDESSPHANARAPYTEVLEVLVGPANLTLTSQENATPEEVPNLGAPTYGSVSIFSATSIAADVSATGMFYPLCAATLNNRSSLGLSNELVQPKGRISVKNGTLFVVYPSAFSASLTK